MVGDAVTASGFRMRLKPLGGMQGQAEDMRIQAEHILKIRDKMNKIMSGNTGQPIDRIEKDVDRDNYMSAEEAKTYGLIDDVLESR